MRAWYNTAFMESLRGNSMMHSNIRTFVTAIVAATFIGCGESEMALPPVFASGNVVEGADGKDVVQFQPGDAAMEAARKKGRATVDRFFQAVDDKKPSRERFNLKIALRSNAQLEHIWLDEISAPEGGDVSGVLLNQPFYSSAHRQGDRISVARDDIVDWSYIEDGYLIGGFTLRVMFEQYPEAQRGELQENLGYKIDPSRGTR